jgi:2-oxoglutarate ferredoxin oxidoreductase subunit alpha
MKDLAAEVDMGRPNMVAFGVLAHWLGLCRDEAAQLVASTFASKSAAIVQGSQEAFDRGFNHPLVVEARAARPTTTLLPDNKRAHVTAERRWDISGNEACGLGALRGGIRFAAAYPITPASDLLEWLAPRLAKLGGSLLQAEDELASINMVIGSSFGGVPALTATSGPGLALMTEGMGLAVAAEIPAVVVNVMRGGPSTGIPTKSEQVDLNLAVYGLHGDAPHLVVAALDHADCVLTTEWAVRLAEALQTAVVVLTDQLLAQSRVICPAANYELPELSPRRPAQTVEGYRRYEDTADAVSPMAIPGQAGLAYVADGLEHDERGKPSTAAADHQQQLDKRLRKIEGFEYGDHWAQTLGNGETAIVTWGSTTAAAREARERLQADGMATRLAALRLLLPAQPEQMSGALDGVSRVLVVEQSHGRQFAKYLRAHYDIDAEVRVLARPGPLPIAPGEIVEAIRSWR